MKNLLSTLLVATTLLTTGCKMNDYSQMSQASGVSEEILTTVCKKITCSYDNLKDRIQVSADDSNLFLALSGATTQNIGFTWVSDSNRINLELTTSSYYGWKFIDSAEIYIGKEKITELSGRARRNIGHYNNVVNAIETVESLSGYISLVTAQKIAEANYKDVTIRFYGDDGYFDTVLQRKHDLIEIVKLAKLTSGLQLL